MTAEAAQIREYLARKGQVYDFDPEYHAAETRLLRLVNPSGNYDVARRAAVHRYVDARKWGANKAFRSWARVVALADLAHVKREFAGLDVRGRAA
jgi:hypothetical protein